jgi:hypothetical protein
MTFLETTLEDLADPKLLVSVVMAFVISVVLWFCVIKQNKATSALFSALIGITFMIVARSLLIMFTGLANTTAFVLSLGVFLLLNLSAKLLWKIIQGSAVVMTSILISLYIPNTAIMLSVIGVGLALAILIAVKASKRSLNFLQFIVTTFITSWLIVYCTEYLISFNKATFSVMVEDIRKGEECLNDNMCLIRGIGVIALCVARCLLYCCCKAGDTKRKRKREEKRILRVMKKEAKKKRKEREERNTSSDEESEDNSEDEEDENSSIELDEPKRVTKGLNTNNRL